MAKDLINSNIWIYPIFLKDYLLLPLQKIAINLYLDY